MKRSERLTAIVKRVARDQKISDADFADTLACIVVELCNKGGRDPHELIRAALSSGKN